MKDLGYKVDGSFLSIHQKVSDLIVFDGPVLSHFKNDDGEDFIYYWIDENEISYRWLIFKIDFYHIKNYITGNHSLRELILNDNIQFYFLADYSNDGSFKNIRLITKRDIAEEYLPDIESYFLFEIPKVYNDLLDVSVLSQASYVQLLREKAFYIKFSEVKPIHQHIISINSLSDYLAKIKKSYSAYVEESFKRNFVSMFTDLADLNKTIDRIVDSLQLRIIDAKIASFGIGFSSDNMGIAGNDIKREIKEWSNSIVDDYNYEVIALDYNDIALDHVLKNYSPEARKNIFKPILDIYSDANVNVAVSKLSLNSVKRISRPSKKYVKQWFEIPDEVKLLPKEKEFVTIAVEIEKGADLNKIPKKVFSSQPLFERRSDSIELAKTELQIGNTVLHFKIPLVLIVTVKNNLHVITSNQLNLAAERPELNDALTILTSTIYNYWLLFKEFKISIDKIDSLEKPDPVMVAIAQLVESVTTFDPVI